MYVAVVTRDRFLAEIRLGKEIPIVRALHTVTQDDDRKAALLLVYEVGAEMRGEKIRLVHNEVLPAKADRTVDLGGSLLDEMQRDNLSYELELKRNW